jgi:valyl-tRNA synthetase
MLHRVSALAAEIDDALTRYRFDVAADRLYHVFWHEYADWYIELVKPELQAGGAESERAVAVLLEVHDRLLRMLHPFIPFVTEEVWQALPPRAGDGVAAAGTGRTITLAAFPAPVAAWADDDAVATMALLQDVVTAVRTVRSEWGVPPAQRIDVVAHGVDAETAGTLRRHLGHVTRLAGLAGFDVAEEAPRADPDTVRRVVRGFELHVPLAGIVNRTQEAERVARELARLTKQRGGLQARLANPAFLERADPDVVRDTREQEAEVGLRQEKLERIRAELAS